MKSTQIKVYWSPHLLIRCGLFLWPMLRKVTGYALQEAMDIWRIYGKGISCNAPWCTELWFHPRSRRVSNPSAGSRNFWKKFGCSGTTSITLRGFARGKSRSNISLSSRICTEASGEELGPSANPGLWSGDILLGFQSQAVRAVRQPKICSSRSQCHPVKERTPWKLN